MNWRGKAHTDENDPFCKMRGATLYRLQECDKVEIKAYASIVERARPFSRLSEGDRTAVAKWAASNDLGSIPVEKFEAAVLSHDTMAAEAFNGDKGNASKAVNKLLARGIVDRARKPTRGHATVYVTFPTLRDVKESAYVPPSEAADLLI